MFALVLMALLVLLALASMAVLADSGLRWWSALGSLRRQLAGGDKRRPGLAPSAPRRDLHHAHPQGSGSVTRLVACRAAA